MQIPGVDVTDYFAPVSKYSTIRTAIAITLYNKDWKCISVDVEAEFLNPTLDKALYIEWPEGMKEMVFITDNDKEEYCIKLKRSMYGNVDAELLWMKQFTKTITKDMERELKQILVDPCMFYRMENNQVILIVIVYVDDTIVTGTPEDVDMFQN